MKSVKRDIIFLDFQGKTSVFYTVLLHHVAGATYSEIKREIQIDVFDIREQIYGTLKS